MATSEKQAQANRRNARKSTGPKDTSVSRFNALKHGLLSKEVLVKGEDAESLQELGKRLRVEMRPVGELENILVDRIVSSVWRLKRTLRVEREMIEGSIEFETWEGHSMTKTLGNVFRNDQQLYERHMRYETTIERQIYRALHELIRLQGARLGEKPPAPLALDVDVSTGS